MELRQFISKALCDIVNGIKDAQKETDKGTIVPHATTNAKAVEAGISDLTSIEFEVTVKTDERTGSEAKLNVVAAIVGGSVKGESGNSSGYASKLSFRVPVKLPQSE